jgi:hypothetical protein
MVLEKKTLKKKIEKFVFSFFFTWELAKYIPIWNCPKAYL